MPAGDYRAFQLKFLVFNNHAQEELCNFIELYNGTT